MPLFKTLIAAMAMSWTLGAHALGTPWFYRPDKILTCPSVGTPYKALLDDLENLKTSIRAGANCNNVIKVIDATKLNPDIRAKFLELIEKSKTEPLTNEEGKMIATYVENITENVGTLIDLFANGSQCFADDKKAADKIASLVGFINEASRLAGSVAGPWGAPIAIGGRVVAGLVAGINEIVKARAGFDYSDPKGWRAYVDNLCSYYEYREQIDALLNPQKKAAELEQLAGTLDKMINSMTERCDDCKDVVSMFEKNAKFDPTVVISLTKPLVTKIDKSYQKPIGSYTLQASGLKQWAISQRERVLADANEFMPDSSGKYLLVQAKKDLDNLLFIKESPKFLSFQYKAAAGQLSQIRDFLRNNGIGLYQDIINLAPELNVTADSWNGPSDQQLFDFLINKDIPWEKLERANQANAEYVGDLKNALVSFQVDIKDRIEAYRITIGAYDSFCQFFRLSGNFNSGIRKVCSYGNLLEDLELVFPPEEPKEERTFSTSVIKAIESTISEIGSEQNFLAPRT